MSGPPIPSGVTTPVRRSGPEGPLRHTMTRTHATRSRVLARPAVGCILSAHDDEQHRDMEDVDASPDTPTLEDFVPTSGAAEMLVQAADHVLTNGAAAFSVQVAQHVRANGVAAMVTEVKEHVQVNAVAFSPQVAEQVLAGDVAATVTTEEEHVQANGAAAFSAKVEEHVREHGAVAFTARPGVREFMRRHLPGPTTTLHTGLLRRPIRREPRRTLRVVRRRRTLARAGPRGRPRRKADDPHHRLVAAAGARL